MMPVRLLLLCSLAAASILAQAPVPGDANADGVLNAADHAFVQAILNRRLEPTAAADVDGDGQVTAIDAAAVADLILGQMPFLAVGAGDIPTSGGTVTAGDLTIVVADGALPTTAQIVVTAADQGASFEGDDDSPLYRIEGIPTRHDVGITLSLPLASAGRAPSREGEILVEVGEVVSLHSTAEPYLAMALVAPRLVDGRLVVDLSVPQLPPVGRDEELPATRTVLVRRVTGVASAEEVLPDGEGRAGVRVTVYHPVKMTPADYLPVTRALGAAIIKLKNLGFNPADRTNPVYVYLKKLGTGTCGYYVGSSTGVDNSSLEINLSYVTDSTLLAELQRTVFHEYFHMVQSRYDPRYAFTQCKFNAPQLWFDEACSVWLEQFTAGGTTSSYMDANAHEVLAGHHMDCSGLAALNSANATKAQNHGYGLSLMLQFLFSHPSAPGSTIDKANPTLVTIYTALRNGTAMREAFLANVPAGVSWWDDMLLAFTDGSIGNPGVRFAESMTKPDARKTSLKLDASAKSPGLKTISIPPLGDRESWAVLANWQAAGAKAKRRLVVEIASPDDALFSRAFNSARNQTNPLAAEGTSFGKYGDWYVSWMSTPMESSNEGLDIRPLHYLLLRHGAEAPAGGVSPALRIWYLDAEGPVHTSPMTDWDGVTPKLIDYSLTGTVTSDDALQSHETVLYDSAALTHVVSRGGASFLVANDGPHEVQVDVQLHADIATESVYVIKQYRVRVYYHNTAGDVREEYLRTYSSPGTTTNISLPVTLNADDRHAFIDVYADEDFKPNAVLEGNAIYSLRSWFSIGTVSRYESTLESRYGKRDGTRGETLPPTCVRQAVLRKDGVTTAAPFVAQPALAPVPAAATGAE